MKMSKVVLSKVEGSAKSPTAKFECTTLSEADVKLREWSRGIENYAFFYKVEFKIYFDDSLDWYEGKIDLTPDTKRNVNIMLTHIKRTLSFIQTQSYVKQSTKKMAAILLAYFETIPAE